MCVYCLESHYIGIQSPRWDIQNLRYDVQNRTDGGESKLEYDDVFPIVIFRVYIQI